MSDVPQATAFSTPATGSIKVDLTSSVVESSLDHRPLQQGIGKTFSKTRSQTTPKKSIMYAGTKTPTRAARNLNTSQVLQSSQKSNASSQSPAVDDVAHINGQHDEGAEAILVSKKILSTSMETGTGNGMQGNTQLPKQSTCDPGHQLPGGYLDNKPSKGCPTGPKSRPRQSLNLGPMHLTEQRARPPSPSSSHTPHPKMTPRMTNIPSLSNSVMLDKESIRATASVSTSNSSHSPCTGVAVQTPRTPRAGQSPLSRNSHIGMKAHAPHANPGSGAAVKGRPPSPKPLFSSSKSVLGTVGTAAVLSQIGPQVSVDGASEQPEAQPGELPEASESPRVLSAKATKSAAVEPKSLYVEQNNTNFRGGCSRHYLTPTFAIPGHMIAERQVVFITPYCKLPAAIFTCFSLALFDGLWVAPDRNGALKIERCWGPAAELGVLANDFIVAVNGLRVEEMRDITSQLMDAATQEIIILVERGGITPAFALPRCAAPSAAALEEASPLLAHHQKRCAVCFANMVFGTTSSSTVSPRKAPHNHPNVPGEPSRQVARDPLLTERAENAASRHVQRQIEARQRHQDHLIHEQLEQEKAAARHMMWRPWSPEPQCPSPSPAKGKSPLPRVALLGPRVVHTPDTVSSPPKPRRQRAFSAGASCPSGRDARNALYQRKAAPGLLESGILHTDRRLENTICSVSGKLVNGQQDSATGESVGSAADHQLSPRDHMDTATQTCPLQRYDCEDVNVNASQSQDTLECPLDGDNWSIQDVSFPWQGEGAVQLEANLTVPTVPSDADIWLDKDVNCSPAPESPLESFTKDATFGTLNVHSPAPPHAFAGRSRKASSQTSSKVSYPPCIPSPRSTSPHPAPITDTSLGHQPSESSHGDLPTPEGIMSNPVQGTRTPSNPPSLALNQLSAHRPALCDNHATSSASSLETQTIFAHDVHPPGIREKFLGPRASPIFEGEEVVIVRINDEHFVYSKAALEQLGMDMVGCSPKSTAWHSPRTPTISQLPLSPPHTTNSTAKQLRWPQDGSSLHASLGSDISSCSNANAIDGTQQGPELWEARRRYWERRRQHWDSIQKEIDTFWNGLQPAVVEVMAHHLASHLNSISSHQKRPKPELHVGKVEFLMEALSHSQQQALGRRLSEQGSFYLDASQPEKLHRIGVAHDDADMVAPSPCSPFQMTCTSLAAAAPMVTSGQPSPSAASYGYRF